MAGQAPIGLRTLSDAVKDGLREAIISGELTPGEPLILDNLAARFGVSRLPVRDALRELSAEGLVTLSSHKHAVVTKLSQDEIRELVAIAGALDVLAASRGVGNIGEDGLKEMARLLDEMRAAEDQPWLWFTLNLEFHLVITKASKWNTLTSLVRETRRNVGRFIMDRELFDREIRTWHAQHEQIYRACKEGQVSEVCQLLQFHWQYSSRIALDHLAQSKGAAPQSPSSAEAAS